MKKRKAPTGFVHEKCECGHCRCQHQSNYAACLATGCECGRYDWPGVTSVLPHDHAIAQARP